eukprot:CAMPEP_0194041488 /NCGR_PEP_ID=MMETSP0009_2-20130614/13391_1 /TAXON_ID=210454 /ORGANISM="Grammatophora oceanica, Strain CCMP 410" /LENGTH=45 /DNA_ID= /DNA_START= /DNA_END= /DNA_ORIENTATION=
MVPSCAHSQCGSGKKYASISKAAMTLSFAATTWTKQQFPLKAGFI